MVVRLPLDDTFFQRSWRREPVLLSGAGRELMATAPTPDELARYVDAANELGVRVRTDNATVWFLEGVVDQIPFAAEFIRHARQLFEWDDVWCDLFRTVGRSSIGGHFDNSDNFTVQLTGTKQWRLSPASSLPTDDVRRRLLGEPGVGSAQLGPGVRTFTVTPGDVLYIPALWVHWGESASDSTSISLVVNAQTAFGVIEDIVLRTLRQDHRWWRVLPIGPGTSALRRREITKVIDTTFTPKYSQDIRAQGDPVMAGRGTRETVDFRFDLDRLRRFVAAAPPAPGSGLLLPSADGTNELLRGLLARRTLRRLLKTVTVRVGHTSSRQDRTLYQAAVDALLAQSDDVLDVACTEPEITSWVAVAEADPVPQATRGDDPLAARLVSVLLPEIARTVETPVVVRIEPDADGAFALRRLGIRLVPSAPTEHVYLRAGDGHWGLAGPTGTLAVYVGTETAGFQVEALPRLLVDGPSVLAAPTAWMTAHIHDDLATVDSAGNASFHEAMTSGAVVLREFWPEAWRELTQSIRVLTPLLNRGFEPYNYSVHGFRGLIMSSPRRSYLAAQTLAHETAHNKLSTLVDLFPICSNPVETVISPVVRAERPLINIFHGCYAFSQEIVLTRRMIGVLSELDGPSMERYLKQVTDKVAAALEVLDRQAVPLPVGRVLMEEVRGVLSQSPASGNC